MTEPPTASLIERADRIPTARVLTWDWREQIDIDQLRAALHVVTAGAVQVYNVDTGSDQYAIVLSNRPLTPSEALAAYRIDGEISGLAAAPVTPEDPR